MLNNKRKLFSIAVAASLMLGLIGANVLAESKSDKRIKYEKMLKEFNEKKEKLEKTNLPKTQEEKNEINSQAQNLKSLSGEIGKLGEEVKTDEEWSKELEVALMSTKLGLEDTKAEQLLRPDEKTQKFIDKLELKLKRIEAEFKEKKKPAKQLLKELRDRSDVDN